MSKAKQVAFADLEPQLHPLLLRALSSLSFPVPTPIQATLIPLALSSSRDVLARARTGSGKTLAYAIPLVQGILQRRDRGELDGTRALVLVPTRELAEQVRGQVNKLVDGLGLADQQGEGIRVVNLVGDQAHSRKKRKAAGGERIERMQLADRPEIVVATPSRALAHLRAETLHLEHLDYLVIDEADLILSYGHSSDDIRSILSGPWGLPKVYQSFLMSATLTGEVEELKGVVLRNPVVLKLEEDEDELANLSQYCVRCSEEDKFLLLYVILKLKLIKGKCLIFVNDTDRGYRVKLFLEKYGIKSGVLNAELPFNSRYHAVQEFNRGVFDYLIATDESGLEGHDRDTNEEDEAEVEAEGSGLITTQPAGETSTSADATDADATPAAPAPSSKKRKRTKDGSGSSRPSTSEYGVSRGVDFVDVACVINFDLPFSSRSYTHRVGRTARAGRTGTSLSFVVPRELWGKQKKNDVSLETARYDDKVWARIDKAQRAKGQEVKEYRFDLKQVEGFRYRMEDGLRSVTKAAVREARIKEIKNEVLNSEKLKAHFEDNPRDLAFLRHDKTLHPSRVQPHLKHVPGYLMPRIAAVGANDAAVAASAAAAGSGAGEGATGVVGNVPFHKPGRGGARGGRGGGRGGARGGGRGGAGGAGRGGKRQDPLKGGAFKFGGGKK
ncbi:P-loop containing nucleoside triphosphate hydrolase protein [Rhodotorula diobovata]|uniref:RNA helicase n=1 Tax=Rhodotorula diobovata TaxID=5288 RepID=A0A5C5G5T3_9BASI|nr:P-loop containing nucleoside triphosphate hydrolase protein [Rhodotorula diobovata]